MQRIAVDMDGVLADVFAQFLEWDERDTGIRKERGVLLGKSELEAFAGIPEYLFTAGFFRSIPVVKDSQSVLLELTKKYEVFVVSAATEFPQSLPEKQDWLLENFPFIDWQHIVFCGSKQIIKADIMIDDHLKNLDYFEGRTILFSQPHNHFVQHQKHSRVSSWQEVAQLLL
jgi:5'(3')-deoxyribonucleotidase